MASTTFSTSVSEQNKKYLKYLEEVLIPIYGKKSAANMETIRFHMEQHEEPLGSKIEELTKQVKQLTKQIEQLKEEINQNNSE